MRFLVSIENEILLFSIFGSFEKIFSLFLKIQLNVFLLSFFISSKNENRPNVLLYFHSCIVVSGHESKAAALFALVAYDSFGTKWADLFIG